MKAHTDGGNQAFSVYQYVYFCACLLVCGTCVCVCVCSFVHVCACVCVQTVTLEGSRGTRQEQLVLHWGWLGTPGRATSSRSSKFAQISS